jgi:hypothetical protein
MIVGGPGRFFSCDGYDKLKRFGFHIYGFIDGYSRFITQTYCGIDNKTALTPLIIYLRMIRRLGKVPCMIRADKGVETALIAWAQYTLRKAIRDDMYAERVAETQRLGLEPPEPLPPLRFEQAFWWGPSTRNVRIERWWRSLADSSLREYLHYFESLADEGYYAEVKPDRIAMRYVYMEMLRVRIIGFVLVHNNHRIRKQPTREHYLPTGKPRLLYEYPNVPDLHEPIHEPTLAWLEELVQDFDIDRYLPERMEELCARICLEHGFSAAYMQRMTLGKDARSGEDMYPHRRIYLYLRENLRMIHGQDKEFLVEQPTPRQGMALIQRRIKAAIPPQVREVMHVSFTGADRRRPFPLEPIQNEDNYDEELVEDIGDDNNNEGDDGLLWDWVE